MVAELVATGQRMLGGELPFFGGRWLEVGWPPAWHRHPLTGTEWPSDVHWSQLSTADPGRGDIKWIWEPSRFSAAFVLARCFAATNQQRYREAFWELLSAWQERNVPFLGPNWYCGQEAALRMFAIDFAVGVFESAGEPPSVEQARSLEQMTYDSARRIALALDYALAQRNNHALSELGGLWAAASCYPAWPEADRWRARAERGLLAAMRDQFTSDGSYIQESFHYHRLAAQILSWLRTVAKLRRTPLPPVLLEYLMRSHRFIATFVDTASGWAPNYGPNDGALLPFSVSEYSDFRPLLRQLAAAEDAAAVIGEGSWDEAALWMEGKIPTRVTRPARRAHTQSGYLCSRLDESLVFVRAPVHRHHRPGHADALHVDLFVAGRNVALDPGTYLYTASPPWDNSLARTRMHNTCSVGEVDQMRRRGRFLWTRWTAAHCQEFPLNEGISWELEVFADWSHRYVHRRFVVHQPGRLSVFDQISGDGDDSVRLHWNLEGTDWERTDDGMTWSSRGIQLEVRAVPAATFSTSVADVTSALGWVARTYGHKQPCTAVEFSVRSSRAAFATFFSWNGRSEEMNTAWKTWCSGGSEGLRASLGQTPASRRAARTTSQTRF